MTLPVSPPVVPASCLVGPSRVVAVACVAWLLLIGACDAADDAPVDGAITADAGQRVDGGETPETAPDAGVLDCDERYARGVRRRRRTLRDQIQ